MQASVRERECESVLVVAPHSSQANRVWCTVGKQEAFVFFHGLQHSFSALSILPSISPTHLAPSPSPPQQCVGEKQLALSTSRMPSAMFCAQIASHGTGKHHGSTGSVCSDRGVTTGLAKSPRLVLSCKNQG